MVSFCILQIHKYAHIHAIKMLCIADYSTLSIYLRDIRLVVIKTAVLKNLMLNSCCKFKELILLQTYLNREW